MKDKPIRPTTIHLYTLKEVCDVVQLSRRTIYNYLKDGSLKAVKVGSQWRVTEEELKAFISRRAGQ